MAKKPIPVIIEDQEFESISAAARFLDMPSANLWNIAHTTNNFNGLSVRFKDPSLSEAKTLDSKYRINYYLNKKIEKSGKKCPVICETLNKKFKSIKDASTFAKVDGWTMSKKMETAGQFKDKNGNIYKRLKPMNTKNNYTNTGDELTKTWIRKKKTETVKQEQPVVITAKTSGVEVATKLLKDKINNYINTNDYKLAKELIDIVEALDKK